MGQPVPMVEQWRGGRLECRHVGHAVIVDAKGGIVESWGDPGAVIYPRSSCKMVQALPMVESGVADAAGLTTEQLALSCASHRGAEIHTARVGRWLADLGLGESALRCGSHWPGDIPERDRLIIAGETPCQIHNNCSGKHAGFLTFTKHLGAGPEYVDPDHPIQRAIRQAFEEVTGEESPGYGIDGCSAPNFATSVLGLGRAMARYAGAEGGDARSDAMIRLREAMMKHPELVAGEGEADTELMRAAAGKAAIKGGADGVHIAILPEHGLGIALKIMDGSDKAREAAIASLLMRLGVIEAGHPAVLRRLQPEMRNWRGLVTGGLRISPEFQ
jgi:L-asparaginase II